MNLLGSIANLQTSGAQLYVEIAQYFKANELVRDIWLEMARDKEQQCTNLKSLPSSFWSELKKNEVELAEALRSCQLFAQCHGNEEHSLQHCLRKAIEFEEPFLLKIYAPLIRQLRTQWTDRALDFYIMVKAHVARLLRVVQMFSGDPIIIQRAGALLEGFERGVQTPVPQEITSGKAKSAKQMLKPPSKELRKSYNRRAQVNPKKRSIAAKGTRTQSVPPRSKPLVKSIELRRRRARF